MSNPFASIETALNASALYALGNATARISGRLVSGVFDQAYSVPLGMSSSAPVFTGLAVDLDAVLTSDSIIIGTDTWAVREIQPDGRGMITLVLESA